MIPRNHWGPAILSNSDSDMPVTIAGYIGEQDGEPFFMDCDGSYVPGRNLFLTQKDAEDARHWATLQAHLHRDGAYSYWWIAPHKISYWFPTGQPRPLPEMEVNFYFGVHPSQIARGMTERARTEDIAAINCLFAEFDAKDFGGDKQATRAHIDRLLPAPTIVVDSGGGYHTYWLLAAPFVLASDADRERARAAQRAWVAFVGGDPGAKDLARVLRVPGTHNLKYDPARPVTFDQLNFARQYKLDALEQLAAAAQPAPGQAQPGDVAQSEAQHWLERALAQAAAGSRNTTGFWLACQLRDNGIRDLQARGIMQDYARQVPQGSSPYTEQEAMASLRQAYSSAPRDPARALRDPNAVFTVLPPANDLATGFELYDYRPEDGGVVDLWLDRYARGWRFVNGWEIWIYWTGTHWAKDTGRCIEVLIQHVLDGMNQAARAKLRAARGVRAQERVAEAFITATKRYRSRMESVEGMAKGHCSVQPDELNAGNLLNMQNGTIDLDTLTLRPHDPNDLLTYVLPYRYDPDATCARWAQFLAEVLVTEDGLPDPSLATLYQELFGYSLTCHTGQEKMIWQAGDGGNGKTVAISVLQAMLGGLSRQVNFNALGMPGNYDLAELAGKRVIFSSEAERGGKMVEHLIRQLVSGETVGARPIYGKPFEFRSIAKIWWSMNDKPTIRDTSNATWRRLILIPFNRTFTDADKDPHLIDKLKQELPGILNWSLEGLARLNENGSFGEPAQVRDAVSEYRQQSNPIAQWLEEQTVELPAPATAARDLYENYKAWCESNGRQPANSTIFGIELKRLKVPFKRGDRAMLYARGVLIENPDAEPA